MRNEAKKLAKQLRKVAKTIKLGRVDDPPTYVEVFGLIALALEMLADNIEVDGLLDPSGKMPDKDKITK